MIKFSEVKKLKKQESASLYIQFSRNIGLVLTWGVLNLFPQISANTITIGMLLINAISFLILFFSVLKGSMWLWSVALLLFNFSIFLDCVDGNIARFKAQQSIYGVYLDRLVHNISYPMLFFTVGFAMFCINQRLADLLILFVAGLFTELSPVCVALEQTENLFVRQLITSKTQIYSIAEHVTKDGVETKRNSQNENRIIRFLRNIYEIIPFWNQLFIVIGLDLFVNHKFPLTMLYGILYLAKQLISQFSKIPARISFINKNLEKATK